MNIKSRSPYVIVKDAEGVAFNLAPELKCVSVVYGPESDIGCYLFVPAVCLDPFSDGLYYTVVDNIIAWISASDINEQQSH